MRPNAQVCSMCGIPHGFRPCPYQRRPRTGPTHPPLLPDDDLVNTRILRTEYPDESTIARDLPAVPVTPRLPTPVSKRMFAGLTRTEAFFFMLFLAVALVDILVVQLYTLLLRSGDIARPN